MPYKIDPIQAPDTVTAGEAFTVVTEVCCENPQVDGGRVCPTSDFVVTVGGQEVFRDIFGLIETCVSDEHTVTIDEPGDYTITATITDKQETAAITVEPADGGNGGGNGGGEQDGRRLDNETALVAGVGLLAAAGNAVVND